MTLLRKRIAFDYCDNLTGRALLIQIDEIVLIYVLDDYGATSGMLSEQLKALPDPISRIQLREVYARHLAANIHIKEGPTFRTEFFGSDGRPRITVVLPELDFHEYEPSIFGRMLAGTLGTLAEHIFVDGKNGKAALDIVATGRVSFCLMKAAQSGREAARVALAIIVLRSLSRVAVLSSRLAVAA